MAYVWQRWLADDFRAAGLEVIEVEGWENRGRPASTGDYDPNGAVTDHHTGTRTSASNPAPTIGLLVRGRPDLAGPLAPWSVDFLGRVWVIAAGRCNHAGRVGRPGVPGMPLGADGNALAMGDEIDTDGLQTMPPAQRRAVALTAAVVLRRFARDESYAHRHEDISSTGKWDLGSLTTPQLRADARSALADLEEIIMALSDADAEKVVDTLLARKMTIKTAGGQEKTVSVEQALRQAAGSPSVTRKELDDAVASIKAALPR